MEISREKHKALNERLRHMERVRAPWWHAWRELSDFFLPRRYPWLLTDKETRSAGIRNRNLLDSTSITALRTLATGMMNGITSPARPWFRLRLSGFTDEATPHESRVWLEEAATRMLTVMSESNFYNALGILYLEWCAMGTASMSIYEDFEDVIRCHNHAVGEFFIDTDEDGRVSRHARKFMRTVEQTVSMFGEENVSETVRADFRAGDIRLTNPVYIYHLIERNDPPDPAIRASAAFREYYWEAGKSTNTALRVGALDEFPCVAPRWETYGSDVYGSSPCMDALPDVRQLQQMIKQRAKGLDKMVDPPMLINQSLASKPKSMLPGGHTYVRGQDLASGARPAYQINIPFQELNADIAACQARIRQVLFNDLFRMISELETVRSATEIDARREEKLVLLGPVLERFESEGLSPCIERIFHICLRGGLFPPPPPELAEADIQIQYVSILADAQRAVGTVSIERYLQLIGNMAAIFPEAVDVPNPEEIIREYADAIGVKTKLQRSRQEVESIREARQEQEQISQAAEAGQALVGGAQQLSQTDMGGGQNALSALIGG
jgi:hypothetical protein